MSFLFQRDTDLHLLPGVNNSDFWGDFIQTKDPHVDRVPLSNAFRSGCRVLGRWKLKGLQPYLAMGMQRGAGLCTLTVFRDLQDVADQGAVAVKRLRPCEVDGSLLCGAQNRDWILRSVGKLPVGTDGCEEKDGGRRRVQEEKPPSPIV